MSVQKVMTNIKQILFVRRVAQLDALNRYYATLAINYFLSVQQTGIGNPGKFWNNQTAQAAARMFTRSFKDGYDYGWLIAHGVDYGVYLTLSNDRRHDALWPIIQRYAQRYLKDARRLFGG